MNIDQLKKQNDLTAAECDALLKLILSTPNRITDKYSDDFDVNFRKIRHKLGRLADIADGEGSDMGSFSDTKPEVSGGWQS